MIQRKDVLQHRPSRHLNPIETVEGTKNVIGIEGVDLEVVTIIIDAIGIDRIVEGIQGIETDAMIVDQVGITGIIEIGEIEDSVVAVGIEIVDVVGLQEGPDHDQGTGGVDLNDLIELL